MSQAVSGEVGSCLGTGVPDPWEVYRRNQQGQQRAQNTPRSSSAPSVPGRGNGQGLGQVNGGGWNQGFVTQPGLQHVSGQGPSYHTGACGFGGVRHPGVPPGLNLNVAQSSERFVAVLGMLQSMNQHEMQVLLHEVSQRVGSNQRMFVPERLGQAAPC